jgi:diguanylate cyclase (GGDEF)-like protein
MDVASFLLVVAQYMRTPIRVREVLMAITVVFAVGAALGEDYLAVTIAAAGVAIGIWRWIELRAVLSVTGEQTPEQRVIAALKPYMSEVGFKAGATIFTRGDESKSLYYLVEGSVAIPEINARISPGQLFGEIALFTKERKRTLGARAETDVKLLEMKGDDFVALVHRSPEIGFFFIGLITQRLTQDFSYVNELFWSAESERQHLFVLATHDGLTGVANRRSFDERLNVEWAHATRLRRPLSLVILDIDHFKQYNDNYGHAEGDAVLRAVAQAMSKCVMRRSDLFARYGGEEFGAILGTDFEAAQRIAERLRASVADLNIKHDYNEGGIVTVSAGVATKYPDRDALMAHFVQAADNCLYRAKAEGRNRVCAIILGEGDAAEEERETA